MGRRAMSIGKRIKELRLALNLNQTDFAKPLGLTYGAIGGYENELRNVSEPSIIAICREYRVNEEWLRSGQGEMFVQTPNSCFEYLAREYNLDAMDIALIREYVSMNEQYRSAIKETMKKVFSA
ncbi:MAG: helix-turn-helix transcriptional regulator [Lachnospiraceae bacterium]|nr:helix-turn-helix transcriptional regulator [Lachnospiraceae bacterium]